jgi:hypothetical protein
MLLENVFPGMPVALIVAGALGAVAVVALILRAMPERVPQNS